MAELINRSDDLNTGRKKLNEAIKDSNQAKEDAIKSLARSLTAEQIAQLAELKADDTQQQLDNIIIESGTSDAETIQARGDYPLLKDRLNSSDSQLAQTEQDLKKHGKVLGERLEGETDDTLRIKRLIDSLSSNDIGVIPWQEEPYEVTTIKLKTSISLEINRTIRVFGENNIGLDLTDCLYTNISGNARISLQDEGQIGVYIGTSDSPPLGNAQLNTITNIGVEGNHHKGTRSLVIEDAWVNNFHNCFFFRSQNGIEFLGSHANSNHFYGCEVRGERTHENSGLAILQSGGGHGNVFHGGAVENYKDGIHVTGGSIRFLGTWIEGFGNGRRVILEGGSLTIRDCYFHGLIDIRGGQSLTFEGNRISSYFSPSILNINYPLISFSADVPTKLLTKGNDYVSGGYLTRYGKYNDGTTGYIDRDRHNFNEQSDEYKTKIFVASTFSEEDIIAGVNDYKRILWGSNSIKFDVSNEFNSSGYFMPKNDGFYQVNISVRLKNISGAYGRATLFSNTAGTNRQTLDRQSLTNRDNDGNLTLKGSTIIKVNANNPVHFEVTCYGDIETFGITGSSTTPITTLSISRLS